MKQLLLGLSLTVLLMTPSAAQNKALHFNGTSDGIHTSLKLPPSYTKEAWIRRDSVAATNNIISGSGHALFCPSSYSYRLASGHSPWNTVIDRKAVLPDVWYHVAVTYDSSSKEMILYRDGTEVSRSTEKNHTGGSVDIGMYLSGSRFSGLIDEVRIWNVVCSGDQLRARMRSSVSPTESGLVGYWNFDDNVVDLSPTRSSVDVQGTTFVENDNEFTSETLLLLQATLPRNGALEVSVGTAFSMEFTSPVFPVAGKRIMIRRLGDDVLVAEVDAASTTGAGSRDVAFTLAQKLGFLTGYYVEVEEGAFRSDEGLDSKAAGGPGAWSFTTEDVVGFSDVPKDNQLYARDENGLAEVLISGVSNVENFDRVEIIVSLNDTTVDVREMELNYQEGKAHFSVSTTIAAGLHAYDFYIVFYEGPDARVSREVRSVVCGDAFIVTGQSNAQAASFGSSETFTSPWIRSYGSQVGNASVDTFDSWGLAQAARTFTLYSVGVWALRMAARIVEEEGIPVCLINGAYGGTTISSNMRSNTDAMNLNTIYGRLLYRLTRSGLAGKAVALFWHQGEADSGYGRWQLYEERFDELITGWHEDYPAVRQYYVFQIHQGCGGSEQHQIRDIQRRLPAKYADLRAMSTAGIPGHDGCHYSVEGYREMGDMIYRLVSEDLYGTSYGFPVGPPALQSARFTSDERDEISLTFDQEIVWNERTEMNWGSYDLKDFFYLNGQAGEVVSGAAGGKVVTLALAGNSTADTITYTPNRFYPDTSMTYQGPWITGTNGVGALTFHNVPITSTTSVSDEEAPNMREAALPGTIYVYPNPANGRLAINMPGTASEQLLIEVWNLLGITVYSRIHNGSNTIYLDLGALPGGEYFIRAASSESVHTGTIMIR